MIEQLKEGEMNKHKECPVCNGEGTYIDEMDYDNNDIPIWNLEKCPQCKGAGKVVNKEIITQLCECCNEWVNQLDLVWDLIEDRLVCIKCYSSNIEAHSD